MKNLYFNDRFNLKPNFAGEYLLFTCAEQPSKLDIMLIISCGITYPNSNRFDVRHSKGGYYSTLCSLIYITGGLGYIETAEGRKIFKKGDIILLNLMNECVFYSDKDDPYSAVWLNYCGTLFHSLHSYYELTSSVIIVQADVKKNMNRIIEMVTELYDLGKKETYNDILHDFLEIFAKISYSNQNTVTEESDLANTVKAYIDQYPKYDLTLPLLSETFHYSTRHIARVFEEHFKITPTKYILKRKIEASKNLLHLDMSSTQIADYLGFCDVNHYIKAFKSIEHTTPAQYKKKINREANQ